MENTVVLYFLRLRFKFLLAISPSMPNIFERSLEVRSFFPAILMPTESRIASIGAILTAFLAGMTDER